VKIFFDVDFTLVGVDAKLRPGVHDLFQRLKDEGHEIYIWSGGRNTTDAVKEFQLESYISGHFLKPVGDDHYVLMDQLNIPTPDFCIDDNKEIIDVFGGYCIPPYVYPEETDFRMQKVYEEITTHLQNGKGEEVAT
jgi:predicted HAD superfamily phosphohydrolase YqeG